MNPEDVKPEVPESPELPVEPEVEPAPSEPVTPPGSKTDSELLLKSLQEERAKRRELEAALAAKEASGKIEEDDLSEEGKVLGSKISGLERELRSMQERTTLQTLSSTYPVLKDKALEFDDYRNAVENKGMSLETAAKAFLAENGLLTAPRVRKGLEEARGGVRTPQKEGMSPEEIDELRTSNYREYSKRVREGSIKLAQ